MILAIIVKVTLCRTWFFTQMWVFEP